MLTALDIQNIVLIERLHLAAAAGLTALTGETGAGKSILLDALGLALGGRAEAGLVRTGAEQGTVSAAFDLPPAHPALARAEEQGIAATDGTLILRRTLTAEGRSKAFINDTPVTVQALRDIGDRLVEIHGQFETHGLLNPESHRAALDGYAGLGDKAAETATRWQHLSQARADLAAARDAAQTARAQEDYLTYAVAELDRLSPQAGEEEALAAKRQALLARQKISGALARAHALIEGEAGIRTQMGSLLALLEKAGGEDATLQAVSAAVDRARHEMEDAAWQLDRLGQGETGGDASLEEIEERYFALRALAKKHNTTADGLIDLHATLAEKLRLATHQEETLAQKAEAEGRAEAAYLASARALSAARKKAAESLARAIHAEFPDLKLEKARVSIDISSDETSGGPHGIDRVQFMIATNPQTPASPLHKIASGGELARFMLALKVVLAEGGTTPTLIFDEADSGIGGATADAVGERLQRLAGRYQVLAVTHSPQVAARAQHHWHVAKDAMDEKGAAVTTIARLATTAARTEEIARMLSGAEITPEARAQAKRLLSNTGRNADAA